MSDSIAMVSGTAWYLWNFRRNVIRMFLDRGWTVHAIAGPDDWSVKLRQIDGITVTDWPVSMDGSNPIDEFKALRLVSGALKNAQPRMVFNNGIKANVYGGIAARRLKFPYVNNVSGLGMRMRVGDTKARLLARLYVYGSAKADALLIQNAGDLSFLRTHGLPESVRTISTMGSGVDLNHFQVEPLPPKPPLRLAFVGRLQTDKGIADLVAAVQDTSGVELTVVGDTTHANTGAIDRATLEEWKDIPKMTFVGHQDDIRPFLKAAHALVMPSHGGEGMPKVILEAAAMGRPALVSDIDGCRDSVIPNQTGWLAPPRDPSALTAALAKISALPLDQLAEMSRAARTRAEAEFSDQIIAQICFDLANKTRASAPHS